MGHNIVQQTLDSTSQMNWRRLIGFLGVGGGRGHEWGRGRLTRPERGDA